MKLTTTSINGDKVMANEVAKNLKIDIDEVIKYALELNLKIKNAQHILSLEDANNLVKHIKSIKQKLDFIPNEWKSYSTIDDFNNLVLFIDKALENIDREMEKNKRLLKNSNNAYLQLQLLEVEDKNLQDIKIYLLNKFDLSLDNLKDKLIFMKSEALEYLDKVDTTLSIYEDMQLSKQEINFNFTASKIARLYKIQMEKIANISNIDKFFSKLLLEIKAVQKREEKFTKVDRDKLQKIFKDGALEEYWQDIYNEWHCEIDKINRLYLIFIKAYFIGKISENMVINIFLILNKIKDDLEEFYLQIRLGIIINYKDNPKSNLLQEINTKDRIFKIYKKSQPKFIELLKNEKSQVAYRFLNRILGDLLEFKIDSEGYEELYQKMSELHSKNLEIYLNDIEIYGKELEKRNLEISKLMFKMKSDLEKNKE